MAKLFWNEKLESSCVDACRAPAKQKLIELRNRYQNPEYGVVFMVNADGNSRPLWNGISDKAVGGYEMVGEYIPKQIDVGVQKSPVLQSLLNSGVRVLRIRSNGEVPDYFTELSEKEKKIYASASGVFRYGKDFWSITARPNDWRFKDSFRKSRTEHPEDDFLEKDMYEIYPIQLQPGDDPWKWVRFVNGLRELPIQYSQAAILPLPLHLAKNLTEYLFDI